VRCGDAQGLGWTYGPAACATLVNSELRKALVDRDPYEVSGNWLTMAQATRNLTSEGLVRFAMAAVDVAGWDLKARLLGVPLVRLLGQIRDRVPVYGSGGFTTYDSDQLTSQLSGWVQEQHIPRVKIKIGESFGHRTDRDLQRIRQARSVIGSDVALFVDANGGYTAKQAIRVAHAFEDSDVTWFEEPVSSDDLGGLAAVRAAVEADVTAGEYGTNLTYFERMCAAGAVDCLQIDATRCGGYTEWLRIAAVADAHHLEVSGHCAPNLHAPVAAATPNFRHLEWFHDHVRIEEQYFDGSGDPSEGWISVNDTPGHGLQFRAEAAEQFRVA
jgi:L-alanine-DL-glutamate epimerase-like enolase superfamily enzyme